MKYKLHILVPLYALLLCGCIRETTPQELINLVAKYQMNTLAATAYYTGSDETYDYFYIDVPLGKNEAVKVLRPETSLTNRFPATREKDKWEIYNPFSFLSLPSGPPYTPGNAKIIVVPINPEKK